MAKMRLNVILGFVQQFEQFFSNTKICDLLTMWVGVGDFDYTTLVIK